MTAIAEPETSAPDEEGLAFRLNGKEYRMEDLTLDEQDEVEELCGGVSLLNIDLTRAKVIRAFVWVFLRRENPDATLEDAGAFKASQVFADGDD